MNRTNNKKSIHKVRFLDENAFDTSTTVGRPVKW